MSSYRLQSLHMRYLYISRECSCVHALHMLVVSLVQVCWYLNVWQEHSRQSQQLCCCTRHQLYHTGQLIIISVVFSSLHIATITHHKQNDYEYMQLRERSHVYRKQQARKQLSTNPSLCMQYRNTNPSGKVQLVQAHCILCTCGGACLLTQHLGISGPQLLIWGCSCAE